MASSMKFSYWNPSSFRQYFMLLHGHILFFSYDQGNINRLICEHHGITASQKKVLLYSWSDALKQVAVMMWEITSYQS